MFGKSSQHQPCFSQDNNFCMDLNFSLGPSRSAITHTYGIGCPFGARYCKNARISPPPVTTPPSPLRHPSLLHGAPTNAVTGCLRRVLRYVCFWLDELTLDTPPVDCRHLCAASNCMRINCTAHAIRSANSSSKTFSLSPPACCFSNSTLQFPNLPILHINR